MSPSSTLGVVDMPAPLGPGNRWTSPAHTLSSGPSSARVLPKSFTIRVVSITGCDGAFMVCPFLRSSCERPKRSPTAFRGFHPGADLASRLSGPQHTSAKPREEGPNRVPTCAQGTDIPMTWGQALGGVKKSLRPASKPIYDGYPVLQCRVRSVPGQR